MDFAACFLDDIPCGSKVLVLKAYFDESISADKRTLTVAGFLLDKEHARRLSKKWGAILRDYGIDWFHMTDCANGASPYDALGRPKSDRLARRLIRAIRQHAEMHIAVSVDLPEFVDCCRTASAQSGIDVLHSFGGPYTWCTQWCMDVVGGWCKERAYNGPVTYIFEQGNSFQVEADRFMGFIPFNQEIKSKYRYYTHAFLPKKGPQGNRLLQASDILAWEWMRDRREQIDRDPIRPRRMSLSFLLSKRIGNTRHCRRYEIEQNLASTLRFNIDTFGSSGWKPYTKNTFDSIAALVLDLKALPPLDPPVRSRIASNAESR